MNYSSIPETPGVYIFKNRQGIVLYVGKAINLKRRVANYFQKNLLSQKTTQLVSQINHIKTIRTDTEFDALLLEARLIKSFQPKYNIVARDDKHPLYIKITKEPYPKIYTVRREDDRKSLYFGPFPSSSSVRDTLTLLRNIFPFCTEKRIGKKPCFYSHIGLCNPCPNYIESLPVNFRLSDKRRYRHNIRSIKRILEGKSKLVSAELEQLMLSLARKEQYQQAAIIKKQLDKLTYLRTPRQSIAEYLQNPNLYSDIRNRELDDIAKLLGIQKPVRIEGYDISNTMGKQATGSMVVFVNGDSDKSSYRRFKILLSKTPDDYAMLSEMLIRRIKHAQWPYPDLLLIDGGIGQVNAAQTVLLKYNVTIPVIGLAKRLEEIIIPDKQLYRTVRLTIGSPGLSLLQRIRDEAHRFARSYHLLLRSKKMIY